MKGRLRRRQRVDLRLLGAINVLRRYFNLMVYPKLLRNKRV
jgi:hypothetical protein